MDKDLEELARVRDWESYKLDRKLSDAESVRRSKAITAIKTFIIAGELRDNQYYIEEYDSGDGKHSFFGMITDDAAMPWVSKEVRGKGFGISYPLDDQTEVM